jgi:hypothetical protein
MTQPVRERRVDRGRLHEASPQELIDVAKDLGVKLVPCHLRSET